MRKKNISRKIVITNFGVLKHVEMSLDSSLNILIGHQASGKSTIAKLIYFCRMIREYLVDYTRILWKRNEIHEAYVNFLKYLQNPFMGCFGTTKHMEKFQIIYFYNQADEKYISITLGKGNYAKFEFSIQLKLEIKNVIQDAIQIMESTEGNLISRFNKQERFLSLYGEHVKSIFCDDEKLIYIPAGRSILSIVPDLLMPMDKEWSFDKKTVDISQTDLIIQQFVKLIRGMREELAEGLQSAEERYLKTIKGQIKNKDVATARNLIKQILKAEYKFENGVEKFFYEEDKWIKLMFSSSGQQEILWALNPIFISILHQEKTFFVLEEPEAHIFPDAQEIVMRLIALLINSNGSEVFLTTHSPYILTSTNLLLFSGMGEHGDSSIIEKSCRFSDDTVSAYFTSSATGHIEDIISKKRKLIEALRIDTISETINEKMDKILRLQDNVK